MEALCTLLPNSKLQYLNLSYNAINDKYFTALCNTLYVELNFITHLNVKGNNIGDAGVKVLSSTLHDTKICSLNLEENEIGDDGNIYLLKLY